LLSGRNEKGLPLLISMTAMLQRFWRVRLEERRILSQFNEGRFDSFSDFSVRDPATHIHQSQGAAR
jgi:hypothetical protein